MNLRNLLAGYWMSGLLDQWVIEKNMLSIKVKIKQIIPFFIIKQTLASTKKQRCIQNPVQNLRQSSAEELKGLPGPHLHIWIEVIWFLSLLIKKRFSPEIVRSVTGFN